jgi:hypothetical protein
VFTAHVVRRLYLGICNPGVWHIDQIVDAESFLAELPRDQFPIYRGRGCCGQLVEYGAHRAGTTRLWMEGSETR